MQLTGQLLPVVVEELVVEWRLNLRFSWLGSVTYFSACLRRRRPGVRSPDQDMHLARRWPPVTATGMRDEVFVPSGAGLTCRSHIIIMKLVRTRGDELLTEISRSICEALSTPLSSSSCSGRLSLRRGFSVASKYSDCSSTPGLKPFTADFRSLLLG